MGGWVDVRSRPCRRVTSPYPGSTSSDSIFLVLQSGALACREYVIFLLLGFLFFAP